MEIPLDECGQINISVYKTYDNIYPIFYIKTDTEDLLPVVDIIEDTLKLY